MKRTKDGPRVLFCDIETLPLEIYAWSLKNQNQYTPLNMMKTDWTMLSWSAKWQGEKKVYYADVRKEKNVRNDKKICQELWQLLDQADIVVWQNGKKFDHKKIRARFILNGMKPPSPYEQIDTKQIASKEFEMTSNSLEYLGEQLNKKHRKKTKRKFSGFSLWKACMEGNQEAFKDMEQYNKMDVLSLEELYDTLIPWTQSKPDFNAYSDKLEIFCNCGSSNIHFRGTHTNKTGKFKKFQCQDCGDWSHAKGAKNNLLPKEKRALLKSRK